MNHHATTFYYKIIIYLFFETFQLSMLTIYFLAKKLDFINQIVSKSKAVALLNFVEKVLEIEFCFLEEKVRQNRVKK